MTTTVCWGDPLVDTNSIVRGIWYIFRRSVFMDEITCLCASHLWQFYLIETRHSVMHKAYAVITKKYDESGNRKINDISNFPYAFKCVSLVHVGYPGLHVSCLPWMILEVLPSGRHLTKPLLRKPYALSSYWIGVPTKIRGRRWFPVVPKRVDRSLVNKRPWLQTSNKWCTKHAAVCLQASVEEGCTGCMKWAIIHRSTVYQTTLELSCCLMNYQRPVTVAR